MIVTKRSKREQQIKFATGIAALDGGKPTAFTQSLLNDHKEGHITSKQLKEAIIQEYAKVH